MCNLRNFLADHAERYPEIVDRPLNSLARDFATVDGIGPRRAAQFVLAIPDDAEQRDLIAADACGYVDDLLTAARELDLGPPVDS